MGRSAGISRGVLIGLGLLAAAALGVFAYSRLATSADSSRSESTAMVRTSADRAVSTGRGPSSAVGAELATFAGGCFWCMEPPFDELDGVISTTSGYTGGHAEDPTYEEVSSGTTGHLESVQIEYDPQRIDYAELLEVFWRNVDPTDAGGQFCDRGHQYTTAIFYHTDEQRQLAGASKRELEASGRLSEPIVTEIRPATAFYPAEEYHQDYYQEHPLRYKFYRTTCGRDRVLDRLWGG